MWTSTLVAQLLTLVLDMQGVDPQSLAEVFPEEFRSRAQRSEPRARESHPWPGASEALADSVRYLEARRLVDVLPDGRIVLARAEAQSPHEHVGLHASPPDEGEGWRVESPLTPPRPVRAVVDPFDFDVPREEA